MTKWVLKCGRCGATKILDVGYNLLEFEKIYIYCRECGENTPHVVIEVKGETLCLN